tara:strand:+ start:3832 stop:4005 length:174 start_codon:yes stop_codon:yes gene_type:complete
MENNTKKDTELTIDINQYVQWDEDGENVIYFNVTNFTNDAEEYLKENNPTHKIKLEN